MWQFLSTILWASSSQEKVVFSTLINSSSHASPIMQNLFIDMNM